MAIQKTNAVVKEVCITELLNEDADKGHWIDLDEDSVHEMFANLANLNEADADAACLDDRYNFKAYGADWYQQRYPGFPNDWYDILAAEHELLNAGQERRLLAINEPSPDDPPLDHQ